MGESWRTRLTRWTFNWAPVIRGTGAWITYIAADWREVRIKLPLSLRTRNYVGTIYGGSMYSAVDPWYMVMLINTLGKGYIVWDKAASIRFRKPGRSTLYARFTLDEAEIQRIRDELQTARSIERIYHVELTDVSGVVHAEIEKVIHLRRATQPTAEATNQAGDAAEPVRPQS